MQQETPSLAGRRILVVEDEYLAASELVTLLSKFGAVPLGPLPSVPLALEFVRRCATFSPAVAPDAVLLDVDLRGEACWPVAEALVARRIPVVLVTGYGASRPASLCHLPLCGKPAMPGRLRDAIHEAVAGAGNLRAGQVIRTASFSES